MGHFLVTQVKRIVRLAEDVGGFAHGEGFHDFHIPALFHRLAVQQIHHLAQGHGAADFVIAHTVQRFPGGHHGHFVIAALGGDGLDAVIGNGEICHGFGPIGQGQQAARKDQLEDQHKGHDGHGPGGGVAEGGDEQAHHVGSVGDEQHGNGDVNDHPGGHEAGHGELYAQHHHDVHAQARLPGAERKLINHVRHNIG